MLKMVIEKLQISWRKKIAYFETFGVAIAWNAPWGTTGYFC
jgi:hypothetical protein